SRNAQIAEISQMQHPAHGFAEQTVLGRQFFEKGRCRHSRARTVWLDQRFDRHGNQKPLARRENRLIGAPQPIVADDAVFYADLIGIDGVTDIAPSLTPRIHGAARRPNTLAGLAERACSASAFTSNVASVAALSLPKT